MKVLLDLGAEQIAGRIILRGQDLAREVNGRWELLPAGEKLLEGEDVDGVPVLMPPRSTAKPASKTTRRRAEAIASAQDADLSGLDKLIED